jgi:hypothetical protein
MYRAVLPAFFCEPEIQRGTLKKTKSLIEGILPVMFAGRSGKPGGWLTKVDTTGNNLISNIMPSRA